MSDVKCRLIPPQEFDKDILSSNAVQQANFKYTRNNGDEISFSNIEIDSKGVPTINKLTIDYIDSKGDVITDYSSVPINVFYCSYPGERILRESQFQIFNHAIDSYSANAVAMDRSVSISKDKLFAYNACVGQENECKGASFASNGIRQKLEFLAGPQTPSVKKPALEMLIPSWFDFAKSQSNGMHAYGVANGGRTLQYELEPVDKIIGYRADAVKRITLTQFVGTGAVKLASVNGVYQVDNFISEEGSYVVKSQVWFDELRSPIDDPKTAEFSLAAGQYIKYPTITGCKLYVHNIFVTQEM